MICWHFWRKRIRTYFDGMKRCDECHEWACHVRLSRELKSGGKDAQKEKPQATKSVL